MRCEAPLRLCVNYIIYVLSEKEFFIQVNPQIPTGCFIIQLGDPDFICVRFPITETHCFTFLVGAFLRKRARLLQSLVF